MGFCKCTPTSKLFVAGILDLVLGIGGLTICSYLFLKETTSNLNSGTDELVYSDNDVGNDEKPITDWREKLTIPNYYQPMLLCMMITFTGILTICAIRYKSNLCAVIAMVCRIPWALLWIYFTFLCTVAILFYGLRIVNMSAIFWATIVIGLPAGYTIAQLLLIRELFYYRKTELNGTERKNSETSTLNSELAPLSPTSNQP